MIRAAASKAPFEWWALSLRGLAVLFGLSVLLIGTQTDRAGPTLTSALLLLLLFPAGLLSALAPSQAGPHVASYTGTILELLIVSLIVGETGGMTSFFFFFYYVPVLIWGTAGRGLVAGVVGGWVSALGYAAAVAIQGQPAAGILPRAALLMLLGLLVGFMEQRRGEAMQSAWRGAEELNRRAHLSAQIQTTLRAMAGQPLAERARRLLEQVLHLADADFGLVAVQDPEDRLSIEAGTDATGQARPPGDALPATAVVEETMRSGLPQLVVDASADARWVSVFGTDAAGSALLVPLRAGDEAFGVVYLARRGIRLFRDEHLGATYALAETASPSVHDALRHHQSREFLTSAINTLAAALEAWSASSGPASCTRLARSACPTARGAGAWGPTTNVRSPTTCRSAAPPSSARWPRFVRWSSTSSTTRSPTMAAAIPMAWPAMPFRWAPASSASPTPSMP